MRTRIFVVDSFTDRPFAGNPAGVCLLDTDVSDEWMQNVAAEMKHAETAFVRFTGEAHSLRWFTPTVEVDLCGHATLAAAHVLWSQNLHSKWQPIRFETRSGILTARQEEGRGVLDFPSEAATACDEPSDVGSVLGHPIRWFGENRMDWMAVLDDAGQVRSLRPDMAKIEALGKRGLIVTAPSDRPGIDFVSRFFAPQAGVPEDSVTGSAHCCLGPYWGERLGKTDLVGYQASERGGRVGIRLTGGRVELIGDAVTVLEGSFLGFHTSSSSPPGVVCDV